GRHECIEPTGLIGPVHRRALLVGDQQEEVGRTRGLGHRQRTLRQYVAKPSSDSRPFWPSSVLWSCTRSAPLEIPRYAPVPPVNLAVPRKSISPPLIVNGIENVPVTCP